MITYASIVNEADVSNGTSLNERAIEDLPIRGRNFAQFMQLTPNSMQEQNRFGIVVNGQRSHLVNISLDGVDFSDPLQGGQRGGGANQSEYFFPQIAVREFQVVRDGASAEVGRTNSGYVNVVTKSGTNTLPRRRILQQPQRQFDLARRLRERLQRECAESVRRRARRADQEKTGCSSSAPSRRTW